MTTDGTATITFWLDDHGVMHVVARPDATQSLDDARGNVRAVAAALRGRQCPLLIDMREVKYFAREVREYYTSEEAMASASAFAVLVGSSLTRTLANMMLSATRTQVPTKLFTDQAKAEAWLRPFGAGKKREVASR
ncbi:MAG TPA: STAS/SEC14 domain-containing protein [Polyangiaceae bacterium]|nr:STAS/SEC14 domain-containing protein [Polyangiaceae bacterium]